LDHHKACHGCTDDLILLSLNRRDDVAEVTGSCGLERSDQRSMALDLPRGRLAVETTQVTEEFIVDVEQLLSTGREVSATFEPHWVGSRRSIEGLGSAGPPIDHHRVLCSIPHTDAPDVQGVAIFVVMVDSTENQRRIPDVELIQPIQDVFGERIAFEAGLIGSTCTHLEVRRKLPRQLASFFDTGMSVIEILLFG
jgi:hypothetical protein